VSLIALPTIDPASPHAFVAAIHSAFTTFRASELGVAIVRADGSAYSVAVAPNGRILAIAPPGEGMITASVPLKARWTPYKALGDWMLYICGAVVLWGIGTAAQRRFAKRPSPIPKG
jgi:apolipoprotein N-acyltransferase